MTLAHLDRAAKTTVRGGIDHRVIVTQGGGPGTESSEDPRSFEVRCVTCGKTTWTPWGADHAEEIARCHLILTGTPARTTTIRVR